MTDQSRNSSQLAHQAHITDGADADFEFVTEDEPVSNTASADNKDDEICWYTASQGVKSTTPISLSGVRSGIMAGTLQADTLLWRAGLQQWVPVAEFVSFPVTKSQELPYQSSSGESVTMDLLSGVRLFVSRVGKWQPSAFHYRLIARSSLALGLLIFGQSLIFYFLRMAWFEGSLLLLIFAAIVELIAVIQDSPDRTTAAPTSRQANEESPPSV